MKLAGGAVVACVTAVLCCTTATSQTSQTHQFIPTTFYTTYSFAHPPALRIKPGDRVITKTIDAAGTDRNNKAVSPGGNPQTGPFYVEGAEPDDMLVVTIEKIEPNRADIRAVCSHRMRPHRKRSPLVRIARASG